MNQIRAKRVFKRVFLRGLDHSVSITPAIEILIEGLLGWILLKYPITDDAWRQATLSLHPGGLGIDRLLYPSFWAYLYPHSISYRIRTT